MGAGLRRWRPRAARPADSTYYFVHTFAPEPEDEALVLGRATPRDAGSAPPPGARA